VAVRLVRAARAKGPTLGSLIPLRYQRFFPTASGQQTLNYGVKLREISCP